VRTIVETLTELSRPVDRRHVRTRRQGGREISYLPWPVICRCLHHRAPGWSWTLVSVSEIGEWVSVTGRLTVPCSDGVLSWDAVASEPLSHAGFAPPIETAASSALRRAAGLCLLGLELWEID
jgi:hypothetical protein